MDNSHWRVWAKVVACLDLVLSSIYALFTICLVSFAGAVTVVVNNDPGNKIPNKEEANAVAWLMWIPVIILVIFTIVEFWAAIQLYKATQMGRGAIDAYNLCGNWRMVCIIFMVVGTIFDILSRNFVLMTISLIIRGVWVFIVCMYMKELQGNTSAIPKMRSANV